MNHRLIAAIILGVASLSGCWAKDQAGPEDQVPQSLSYDTSAEDASWYNTPGLRAVFGDFGPAEDPPVDERRAKSLTARGEYVVRSLAACGICHGSNPENPDSTLTGGREMTDSFGSVVAPNITPDRPTGIGDWSYAEIVRALRASIDRRGKPLSIDLHAGYRWMSDRDAKAVAVFLKSQKPVRSPTPRRELGGFQRNAWGLFPQHQELKGFVPVMPDNWPVPYGRHLATEIARCQSCHTPGGFAGSGQPFAGAEKEGTPLFSLSSVLGTEEPSAEKPSNGPFPTIGPDIRGSAPSGLGGWSVEQIVNYLQTGRSPSGKSSAPALCPWRYYSGMTQTDKEAIAKFLKSL